MEKKIGIKRKARNVDNSNVIILWLVFLIALTFIEIRMVANACAAQTTGGVTWIDTLQYTKPTFVPITVPDSCGNTYYINLSAGSNGSGTESSPFNSFNSLNGKSGMSGGPACVYVRGSGTFQRYNASGVPNFWGSLGNEIYIRPWPGYTATLTYNYIDSSTDHFSYIIWDGGPSMDIHFVSGSSDYHGAWNFKHMASDDNLTNWTFYRTQWTCSGTGQLFSAWGRSLNVSFINNEFYNCDNGNNNVGHQIYLNGADQGASWPNDCSSVNCAVINYTFKNNIIRDNNNGLEVNMRDSPDPYNVDGLIIEGNAFHNIGKGLCSTSWNCRPAITLGKTSKGNPTFRGVVVKNNLMWDIASGCIWPLTGTSDTKIYNNICYDYGKGSPKTGGSALCGMGSYDGSGAETIKNNIIYGPSDTCGPFYPSGKFVKSNNVCTGCDVAWQSGIFLSTDQNNADFLKISPSSLAKDAGATVGVTNDYKGALRPQGTGYDIGAFEYIEYSSSDPAPMMPYITKIQ